MTLAYYVIMWFAVLRVLYAFAGHGPRRRSTLPLWEIPASLIFAVISIAAVFLIGMQPAAIADQHSLSPAVSAGMEALAAFFRSWSSHLAATRFSERERVDDR